MPSTLPLWAILAPFLAMLLGFELRPSHGRYAALAGALAGLALGAAMIVETRDGTRLFYDLGGYAPPFGIGMVADSLSAVLVTLSGLVTSAATAYVLGARRPRPERRYNAALMGTLLGLTGIFLTSDLFNFYVFLEVTVVASTPLVAYAGDERAPEATLKYVLLTLLGSTTFLAGTVLTYAHFGTLNFGDLAERIAAGAREPATARGLLAAGLLVKSAAVPFHMWQPDAHSTAPSASSAILSGLLVKSGAYGILRLDLVFGALHPEAQVLLAVGAITALFGGFAALATVEIKRLLAYSTISQMGLVLAALAWGGRAGITAAVLLMIAHAVTKTALFLLAGALVEHGGVHEIAEVRGLGGTVRGFTVPAGVALASLAGIPPTAGFLGKLAVLRAGIDAGSVGGTIFVGAAAALGIAYSARLFAALVWGNAEPARAARARSRIRLRVLLSGSVMALLALALGILGGPVLVTAQRAATDALDVGAYAATALGRSR